MKEEASIYAMVMTIVVIVTVVLLTVFVIKCWQMKEEEIQRDQVQSETETDEPEPETPETAAAVSEADVSETDNPESVQEAGELSAEDGIVNGPEEIQAEPETSAAVRDTLGCPEEILIELRARLKAYGIEWWEPYALAQMFQESHFNPYAENKNGLDKGLIQYRITYWAEVCSQHGLDPATSIFDWKAQLQIYVQDTARRLGSGCSIQETISRHMMSDYGPYCETYVKDVMRWVR